MPRLADETLVAAHEIVLDRWKRSLEEDEIGTVLETSREHPSGSDRPALRPSTAEEEFYREREYAQAERERIKSFIEEYERKAEAGSDMDIRGQRERLDQLEQRIETRREELKRQERVISLAPEVENYCLTIPL